LKLRLTLVFSALATLLFSGVAFADQSEVDASGGAVFATPAQASVSEPLRSPETEREKQKAIDDMNAFLIESYKIKLDKLLSDVYRAVRNASKDDPAIQVLLLKRVLAEINAKMDSIAGRDVSPNRKKILLSVFAYLQKDVEEKIASFETK
jgi:hypothetical protein